MFYRSPYANVLQTCTVAKIGVGVEFDAPHNTI